MAMNPRGLLPMVIRRLGFDRDWVMIPIGAGIGVVGAAGAMAFAETLHGLEHVARLTRDGGGAWSVWLLPLLPMVGALVTGVLVHRFASEARGHGVPQVIRAILKGGSNIPLRIGIVKVIASIATVGTGGSAGTEGPIVQIGATAGSAAGRWLGVAREHRSTLVGCGAAAGIASIFNAPIAGVFFVIEILLKDLSHRTITPVVVASVLSAATTDVIKRWLDRPFEAIFFTESLERAYTFTAGELPLYGLLGIVCGLLAVGFNRLLHSGEDLAERVRVHPVVKPVLGAAGVGVLGIAFVLMVRASAAPGTVASSSGMPAFFGNGYDTIRWLLEPGAYLGGGLDVAGSLPPGLWLLLALVGAKAVATVLTLASGGSGGVFAPSLFLGAVGGGAFGIAMERLGLLPGGSSPAAYALVGMAAVVAGSTHALLTAILILFELTRDEYVLLPIMLAATVAKITARAIDRDSIYTAKLRREGVLLGTHGDLTILRRLHTGLVEPTPLPPDRIFPADPLSKLIAMHAVHQVPDFPVVDADGRYLGMVTGQDVRAALIDREAIPLLLVAELIRADVPTVTTLETLDEVMRKFAEHDVTSFCLVDDPSSRRPVALITRSAVLRRYQEALGRVE